MIELDFYLSYGLDGYPYSSLLRQKLRYQEANLFKLTGSVNSTKISNLHSVSLPRSLKAVASVVLLLPRFGYKIQLIVALSKESLL
jgi:hypothetical protein